MFIQSVYTSSYAISMSNSELIDQFRNFIDEKCKEKLNLIKYLHVLMITLGLHVLCYLNC